MQWQKPLAVCSQFPGGGADELTQGCKNYQARLRELVATAK